MSNDFERIERLSRDEQVEIMEQWFRENFEDPAERTPYESAEGGYQYIWGGPYDAHEELSQEFEGKVPDKLIEDLANSLSSECAEWAPVPSDEDYDRTFFDGISSNKDPFETFSSAMEGIRSIALLCTDSKDLQPVLPLLYVNVISAFETYLSDTFINIVLPQTQLLRKFLETTPEFMKRSIAFSDVLSEAEKVPEEAKRYLLDVVWHNLGKVQAMYRDTLQINFGSAIKEVAIAISIRHDIVHRNGKKKDGSKVLVGATEVKKLIEDATSLVWVIKDQMHAPKKTG